MTNITDAEFDALEMRLDELDPGWRR